MDDKDPIASASLRTKGIPAYLNAGSHALLAILGFDPDLNKAGLGATGDSGKVVIEAALGGDTFMNCGVIDGGL